MNCIKVLTKIINENQVIVLEDLHVKTCLNLYIKARWGPPVELGETCLIKDIDQEAPTSKTVSFKWRVVH